MSGQTELQEQNDAEAAKLERKHRPSLKNLGIYYHSNVSFGEYDRYHSDCGGMLEVVETFGDIEEDKQRYDFAFAEIHCTEPGCKYPDFCLPNPDRQGRGVRTQRGAPEWKQKRKDM